MKSITMIQQKQAAKKCGVSPRKFADMVKEIEGFPQPKKLAHSARLKFFVAEEIDEWLHEQISESDVQDASEWCPQFSWRRK